jgi:hypothetical protein
LDAVIPELVHPPTLTVVKFVLVLLAVQAMLLYAVFRTAPDSRAGWRRVAVAAAAFALVMVVTGALASSGLLAADPLWVPAYPIATVFVVLFLGFGRPGAAMAAAVAPVYWVLFQGFRLPLEIVLHSWARAGTIPVQMTWSGQNFDIVSGLLALAVGAAWLTRPKATWLGVVAHIVGLALLLNVGRIVLLSLPTPLRAFEGAPLLLPFHVPYTWIVPFAVGAALFGHVVGLRAIRRAQRVAAEGMPIPAEYLPESNR